MSRSSSRARRASRGRSGALLLALLAAAVAVAPVAAVPAAGTTYPALTADIHGPTVVGTGTTVRYALTATGGPAFGFNGTQVGVLSFSSSIIGLNTTGVQLLPTAGVYTHGFANLTLTAGNLTQTLTINLEVKSGYAGQNASTNLSYTVHVIVPYEVRATLLVDSATGTLPFDVTVSLDGAPVGTVAVPSLTGHSTYGLDFRYVNPGLGPGWHTFRLDLAEAHGLVVFSNGASATAQSFYISPPAPNDTIWYATGAAAFVGVIFIMLTAVGARRRGRKR